MGKVQLLLLKKRRDNKKTWNYTQFNYIIQLLAVTPLEAFRGTLEGSWVFKKIWALGGWPLQNIIFIIVFEKLWGEGFFPGVISLGKVVVPSSKLL